MNLLPFVTPVIKQIAPVITEKIKNKISPDELQQAILAGIKAADLEEKKLSVGQNLFFKSHMRISPKRETCDISSYRASRELSVHL